MRARGYGWRAAAEMRVNRPSGAGGEVKKGRSKQRPYGEAEERCSNPSYLRVKQRPDNLREKGTASLL